MFLYFQCWEKNVYLFRFRKIFLYFQLGPISNKVLHLNKKWRNLQGICVPSIKCMTQQFVPNSWAYDHFQSAGRFNTPYNIELYICNRVSRYCSHHMSRNFQICIYNMVEKTMKNGNSQYIWPSFSMFTLQVPHVILVHIEHIQCMYPRFVKEKYEHIYSTFPV